MKGSVFVSPPPQLTAWVTKVRHKKLAVNSTHNGGIQCVVMAATKAAYFWSRKWL